MNAIIHAKLVMEDGIIWDGTLLYEGKKNGRNQLVVHEP